MFTVGLTGQGMLGGREAIGADEEGKSKWPVQEKLENTSYFKTCADRIGENYCKSYYKGQNI